MLHNSSSSPSSSSLPSDNYFMHRSSSTHLLHIRDPASNPFFFPSSPTSKCEVFDFPFRRVFSTSDACAREGMVVGGRAGKYNAEERMKRIERFRSKRTQRNFHKKITYACRKTLADSRPRVRGRFMRNGETDAETESKMDTDYGEWWRQMQTTLVDEGNEKSSYNDDIWASLDSVLHHESSFLKKE